MKKNIRLGLMGFGRVGRNLFRILHRRDDMEITAISDIADTASLAYLLRYDTILGRYPEHVAVKDGTLLCGSRQIQLLSGKDPGDMDWAALGVDIVVEATGKTRTRKELLKHLDMGAKKVLACVPIDGAADVTAVSGYNEKTLNPGHKIIAHGSMTAHALLPILATIDKLADAKRVFYTTTHAYSKDQHLADVPASDLRRSRAATENIVPIPASSESLLGELYQRLAGKISGMSLRVPIINGTMVDMVIACNKPISVEQVNNTMAQACQGHLQGIVEYSTDPIASSDVRMSPYSATYDSLATMALGENMIKVIFWFDNGWGYAHRAVETIKYLASKEGELV